MYTNPWTPHALSLRDYFAGDTAATIVIHSDLGEHEELPVAGWFRAPSSPVDLRVFDLCRGRVLDVGAGTGVHTVALQERGFEVCAIDFVAEAVEIMRQRGVRDARSANLFEFRGGSFETILVLANGAALRGVTAR